MFFNAAPAFTQAAHQVGEAISARTAWVTTPGLVNPPGVAVVIEQSRFSTATKMEILSITFFNFFFIYC